MLYWEAVHVARFPGLTIHVSCFGNVFYHDACLEMFLLKMFIVHMGTPIKTSIFLRDFFYYI